LNLDVSKLMLDRFEKKYPFIKTELFRAGRGPLLNKVLAEAMAGRHVWDALSGTGEMQPSLMERKLLGSYLSPERQRYEEGMKDPDGRWTAMYVNPYVLGYNTKLVRKESVPRSYADLLDPKWRGGKISLDSDAYPILSGLAKAWGKEKAVRYLKDLAALEPSVKRGNAERVQLTAAGEYPLLIAYSTTIELLTQKGAPIDWVSLEPVVVQVNPVQLAAGAPHPNAARLFVDFALAREGQEVIRDTFRIPARTDVDANPPRLSRGYRKAVVGPGDYGDYAETVKLYQEIFRTR
jgi:ABC-type Fe3+ transport system substrate-binding protein